MMKIDFKVMSVALALVLIFLFVYHVFQTSDYWAKKEAYEKSKEVRTAEIEELKKESQHYARLHKEFFERAEKEAMKRKKLEQELWDSEMERRHLKSKVVKMKTDEVVSETVRMLAIQFDITNEHIWKTADGIQFTLEAARANLTNLVEWEHYKYDSIPRYEKLIVSATKEIEDLRTSIQGYEQNLQAVTAIIQKQEEQMRASEEILAACERKLRGQKFKILGFTAGTAVVVGGLILLIK